MKKLLIATRNKDKLREIRTILAGVPYEIIGLDETDALPADFEVEETAATFEGNAIIKAIIYGKKTGLMTLADDSGLGVDALDGRPGVMSARYAPGTAADRNEKLLTELAGIPREKRTARYAVVMAIYNPETEQVRVCEGKCEGIITEKSEGEGGFGYDPIFFSVDLKKTMAQATAEEKNSVSHRGKALQKVREIVKEWN